MIIAKFYKNAECIEKWTYTQYYGKKCVMSQIKKLGIKLNATDITISDNGQLIFLERHKTRWFKL